MKWSNFGVRFLLTAATVVMTLDISQAASGLAAYWPFNEGTGDTAHDLSGNRNNGLISGAQWVTGVSGTALQFGGSSMVSVPDNASLDPATVTVEAWVYSDSFQADCYGIIVTKENGSAASYRLQLYDYSGSLEFVTNNTWDEQCVGATVLANHKWHQVAGEWTNDSLKVFVDGKLDGAVLRSGSLSYTTDPLIIGYTENNNAPFNGKIEQVRIFNYALPPDSILAYYNAVSLPVVPAVPLLSAPSNTASNLPTSLTLSWSSAARAENYSLQVSTNSSFSTITVGLNGVSTLHQALSGLPNSTVFYWCVDAGDAGGVSAWSNIWSFTTARDSTIPLIIPYTPNPTRNRQPTLLWHPVRGAASYSIQINDVCDFTTPLIADVAADSFYTPRVQLPIGPIYWHVMCNLGSRYSAIDTFTIVSDSVPILVPMVPDTQPGMPLFKWYSAAGAQSYRIQIDTSGTFVNSIISTLAADTLFMPSVNLPAGKIVWRVGSVSAITRYSNADTFWVKATAVLPDASRRPSLRGVTYVPMRNGMQVDFSLIKESSVSLDIVTLKGDRIATVFRGMVSAGNHGITWNGTYRQGTPVPTGTYLVVCKLNGNLMTREMTIMR